MAFEGPPKVVFLDVDGVLACTRSLLGDFEPSDETLVFCGGDVPLERACLEQLKWVLDRAGPSARVVVSSTWRLEPDMRQTLLDGLAAVGIDPSVVIGDTPQSSGGRGLEVASWMAENGALTSGGFVVLDDGHVESLELVVPGRLVRTKMEFGLTPEAAKVALEVLNTPPDVFM